MAFEKSTPNLLPRKAKGPNTDRFIRVLGDQFIMDKFRAEDGIFEWKTTYVYKLSQKQ